MRKLKRFLSLFLASSLLMGLNVQAMPVEKTDTDIAKLEIEVNGEGKVTIDDGHSKYFLENKDVFRADCTVDTNLKITATPNEGYYIASVNGIDSNGISDGNSKIYDVNLQENKTSITINFLEEKKEETNNEINQSNTNEEESKEDTSSSIVEVKEANEFEGLSEDEIIIEKYNRGIKFEKEQIEARKKLATEKNLLDYVDENYFLVEEYLKDKSSADLIDEEILILVNSLSYSDINEFLALSDSKNNFYFKDFREVLRTRNKLNNSNSLSISARNLVVGNAGAVTEYYQGYAHTAPMLSVAGKQAFCVTFERPDPSGGTVAYDQRLANNEMLRKVLYYGYRGPGTGSIISQWSSNQNLLMIATTQAASKANGHKSYALGNDFYNYVSGLPSPPSGFTVYIVSTGGSTQDLAFWENISKGSLQISKESADPSITNGNSYYDITGAEYGVYTNSNATGLVGTLVIGSNGWSQEIQLDAGTYYLKETKAPKGYSLDTKIYPITVNSGTKTTRAFKDNPQYDPVSVLLRKVDSDTGNNKPQGSGTLAEAQFTFKFYAGEYNDGVNPADLGVTPTRTWIMKTDSDGFTMLDNNYKVSGDPLYIVNGVPTLPLGTVTIQETKAPIGYKINPEIFVKKITPTFNDQFVNTYNEPIIKEDSLNFVIKKVQSGTLTTIPNAKFKHTNPDGSTEELQTGTNGEVVIRGLTQGTHRIVEFEAPEGYEVNTNEFKFEVQGDNTIKVISNTTNMGMSYSEFEGDGILTVNDEVKPYSLRLTKVNDKGAVLEGAEFTLYSDSTCNNAIETQVSDAKGNLKFNNLKPGTKYYMKETKAPQGYRIPIDIFGNIHVYEIYVEATPVNNVFDYYIDGVKYTVNDIDSNKDVYLAGTKSEREVNMKVVNRIGMKLPKTGSGLMIPILIVAVGLMSYSVFSNKNKIKDDGEGEKRDDK